MASSRAEQDFEALLEHLKRNRGFDFTGYKRPSLARRIQKRMETVGVSSFADYQDYLEVHPEEFAALFNTILINVTAFFRDEASWKFLAEQILPGILTAKGSTGTIRVWSAGCASGEEAYTLAMLIAEAIGPEAFIERVKIYATDVDEEALAKGRQGVYSEAEVADVPEALRAKYFDVLNGSYVFRRDLRRQVIFGRHDLITDAPISRVDLLVCRNTLMYLNAETQAKILGRFYFALNDGGVLFLGRAETLLTHGGLFEPVDLKHRVSTKVARGHTPMRDRLLFMTQNGRDDALALATLQPLREIASDALPVAQLVVDGAEGLVHANERARLMFGLTPSDITRPLQDLKVSYRPVELRSLVEQVRAEMRTVVVREVEWQPTPGEVRYFDVSVVPLIDGGAYSGASVTYSDVSVSKRLQRELEHARQELETAYEELQSTNEELETTNEELQSTVEELETTNEELQSTNEELETMNEELQSTNEELTAINDELRDSGVDLANANLFLESVMSSVEGGVVVVDRDSLIVAWSRKAQDLWGLRDEEVLGKHLLGLDIGLPVGELRAPLKRMLAAEHDGAIVLEMDAINRRGRPLRCRVSISPLRQSGETRGAILLMEDAGGGAPARGSVVEESAVAKPAMAEGLKRV